MIQKQENIKLQDLIVLHLIQQLDKYNFPDKKKQHILLLMEMIILSIIQQARLKVTIYLQLHLTLIMIQIQEQLLLVILYMIFNLSQKVVVYIIFKIKPIIIQQFMIQQQNKSFLLVQEIQLLLHKYLMAIHILIHILIYRIQILLHYCMVIIGFQL